MIYIIEDDPWQAEQFSRVLKEAGYKSSIFYNGVDVMAAIDKRQPDVIILDMLLAGTTGVTLLHELQSYSDTGAIPVILCSSLGDTISQADLAPYGVKRVIDKSSMNPDEIVTAVKAVR